MNLLQQFIHDHIKLPASRWRGRKPWIATEPLLLLFIAAIVGTCAGILADILKYMLTFLWRWLYPHFSSPTLSWRILLMPLGGILVTYIYQRFILRQPFSNGTARVIHVLDTPSLRYRMRADGIWNSVLCCSATVGMGASAGAEGPMAYAGASLGGSLARRIGLSPSGIRLLIGIGAGAGIAGIFKAPVGGVLYTLEVLQVNMSPIAIMALILACVCSAASAYLISGTPFDMPMVGFDEVSMHTLGWVVLAGIVCGMYGLWYEWSKNRVSLFFRSLDNDWAAPLISGVGMSLALLIAPALFGEGMEVITAISRGDMPHLLSVGLFATDVESGWRFFAALGFILLIKGSLVAAANDGGGVAGEMVPAMFAGCVAGYMFASGMNLMFGLHLPVWTIALASMGAGLANSTHAPLMASFIVYECTNSMEFLPYYLACAMVSYGVMKVMKPTSVWLATGRDDLMDLVRYIRQNRNL